MKNMNVKDLPEIFRPFYDPPEAGCGFNTRLGKNLSYARNLVARGEEVREAVLDGLRMLKEGCPEEPNGSFAIMNILDSATQLALSDDVPLFLEMLSWTWISSDHQYPLYVLGVAKLGFEEDIPLLQEFCRQLEVEKIPAPDRQRIIDSAELAIGECRLRGPRNVAALSAPTSIEPNNLGYVR
jgi:hypothetical protein